MVPARELAGVAGQPPRESCRNARRIEGKNLPADDPFVPTPPDPIQPTRNGRNIAMSCDPSVASPPTANFAIGQRKSYSSLSTAMNAFWLISTLPIAFIRFFPSFCFCNSFRFRVMSPP